MNERLSDWQKAALLLGFLTALYTVVFLMHEHTSDEANTLLAGIDLIGGNLFLKGWYFPRNSYLFTDILPYGILSLVFGKGIKTLVIWPALLWAAIVTTTLIIQRQHAPHNAWGRLLLFTAIGMPLVAGERTMGFISQSPMHIGTLLLGLGMMCLADRLRKESYPLKWSHSVFVFCVTLGMMSDPMILVIAIIPIFLSLLTRPEPTWPKILGILGLGMLGIVLSKAALGFIQMAGGFESAELGFRFAEFPWLLRNALLFIEGVLMQLGADFSDRTLSSPDSLSGWTSYSLVLLSRVGLALLIMRLSWGSFKKSLRNQETSFLVAALSYSVTLISVAEVFSTLLTDLYASRYSIPLIVNASLLAALTFAPTRQSISMLFLGFLPTLAAFLLTLCLPLRHTAVVPYVQAELAHFLIDNQLTRGYAAYWDAGIVSVATKAQIQIQAIQELEDGELVKKRWLSRSTRFEPDAQGRGFFAIPMDNRPMSFSEEAVLSQFGPPDRIEMIEGYRILIYAKRDIDIGQCLRSAQSNDLPDKVEACESMP